LPSDGLENHKASGPDGSTLVHFRRLLEDLSDTLDERDKEILTLYFLDGMKQEDIAESLRISRRSVVKRLARIREKTGKILEGTDV